MKIIDIALGSLLIMVCIFTAFMLIGIMISFIPEIMDNIDNIKMMRKHKKN